ncbi:phage head closure protein [Peptoclostridium litorale]|nr:phage head closure protein [Peptoclostridium litorale]
MLNKRIIFQTYVNATVNENGFLLTDDQRWQDHKKVWAGIKTLKGREYYEAAATQNENQVKFITRYHAGITADMRIKMGERVFEIQSVVDVDEKHKELNIMAKEQV